MNKKEQTAYTKILNDLTTRRSRGQESEVLFLLHLREVLTKHLVLLEAAHGTIGRFLKSNKHLYDLTRYNSFCDGLKYVAETVAVVIGHEMVIALSKADIPENVPAAVQAANEYVTERGAKPDSRQSYHLMVRAGARTPAAKGNQEQVTIAQLLARIEVLEAELQGTKLKLREATTELRKAKRQPSKRAVRATA